MPPDKHQLPPSLEKVIEELLNKGISNEAIEILKPIIDLKGTNIEKLEVLSKLLSKSDIGKKGIEELNAILSGAKELSSTCKLEIDITLARGLNYYTGAIIEVKTDDLGSTFTGSICGGGRYDDLTGIFGLPNMSGVGISFGADRIYDVLEEIKAFPDFSNVSTRLLFVNFGDAEAEYCSALARKLRRKNINTEVYPDAAKMKKQMAYADKKNIPFVALIGSDEMNSGLLTVKNMQTGEQLKVNHDELPEAIS